MGKILTKRNFTFGLLLVAFIIIFEILLRRVKSYSWAGVYGYDFFLCRS